MSEPDETFIVPPEYRLIERPGESRELYRPADPALIVIGDDMVLGSKKHTVGATKIWTVDYSVWLDNAASIAQFNAVSSSETLTVGQTQILGKEATFTVTGGAVNEQVTITLTVSDTFGNVQPDTVLFMVVAP